MIGKVRSAVIQVPGDIKAKPPPHNLGRIDDAGLHAGLYPPQLKRSGGEPYLGEQGFSRPIQFLSEPVRQEHSGEHLRYIRVTVKSVRSAVFIYSMP